MAAGRQTTRPQPKGAYHEQMVHVPAPVLWKILGRYELPMLIAGGRANEVNCSPVRPPRTMALCHPFTDPAWRQEQTSSVAVRVFHRTACRH